MTPDIQNTTRVEARAAQGALVVSFSGPGLPKVWRADMAHVATSALELQEAGGKISLVMKTPSSSEEVYVFPDRQSAVDGLKVITRALFAQGSPALSWSSAPLPAATTDPAPAKPAGPVKKTLKILGYLVLVFLGVSVLAKVLVPPAGPEEVFMKGATAPLKAVQKGVPVPADQLFGK